MIWKKDRIILQEVIDFDRVEKEIVGRGNETFDYSCIKKAVEIKHDDVLCGYLLTCEYAGIRSFHGFKFVEGGLEIQMPLLREYIKKEDLKYSAYMTKETRAVLRLLGFKEFTTIGNVTIMRKD